MFHKNTSSVSIFGNYNRAVYHPVISGKKINSNFSNSNIEKILRNIYLEVINELDNVFKSFNGPENNYNEDFFKRSNLERISLNIFKNGSNNEYINKIFETLQYSINILQKGYSYYLERNEFEIKFNQSKECCEILNDVGRLKEYLKKFKKGFKLIEDQYISLNVKATVKEEYLIYIRNYGYPEDGIFDPILLNQIKSTLYK